MKDGLFRVSAAAPEIVVADCAHNGGEIRRLMKRAADGGASLLALPEMCVTGYTCGDLFAQHALLERAKDVLIGLRDFSGGQNMLTIAGVPLVVSGKLYNCAAVLFDGRILGVVPKSHLPNYNEFYELRKFSPAPEQILSVEIGGEAVPFGARLLFQAENLPDFVVGVEICEDLWVPDPPSRSHAQAGATVIVNCSASNETAGKAAYRRELVRGQSARLCCAYLYADAGQGESTTDIVFSGHQLIAENGVLLAESKPFEGGVCVSEVDVDRMAGERRRISTYPPEAGEYRRVGFAFDVRETAIDRPVARHPFIPQGARERAERAEDILNIQSAGLKKRLEHTGARSAVVGVSGGLDSCLALLVTVRAMDRLNRPRSDVIAVTMPGFGTTRRTRNNAQTLCEKLNVTFMTVDITEAVLQHFQDIGQDPDERDVTYENCQARERTQVLMDIANKTGGLVVGTGDLSELALGWATYNGDHMSMYGVNASVPKTLIRHMIAYIADNSDEALCRTLCDILDTPVSPELLPATGEGKISQRTEELVGPYELHDFFLYYALRYGFNPRKILRLACHAFDGAYPRDTILFWLKNFYRRFFSQQFKRSCLPDGPKVGSVSLSPRGDWRMPSDASAGIWLDELEGEG